MLKEIAIATAGSAAGAVVTVFVLYGAGIFEKELSDSQVGAVSRAIVDDKNLRESLVRNIVIPRQKLHCQTTQRVTGRTAKCPKGYVVTGCSARGKRTKGQPIAVALSHNGSRCSSHDKKTDWTEARCCRLQGPP